MGVHLSFYVSKKVTIEEIEAWAHDKDFDAIEVPTPEKRVMIDRVNRLSQSWEHGMKCAPFALKFLQEHPHVITDDLIQRVVDALKNHPCELNSTDERLREHIGALVWAYAE